MYKHKRLFAGLYPTGIVYADRKHFGNGGYLVVAFLPYHSLELEIKEPNNDLLSEIEADAAQYKAGDKLQISASGQYIVLGS